MRRLGSLSFIFLTLFSGMVESQVKMTPKAIFKKHFTGLKVERKAVYLDKKSRTMIEKKLGGESVAGFYTFYVASKNGKVEGYALFDTHKVRTKEETVGILLDSQGLVKLVELISFYEPDEYAPPIRWLDKFIGKNEEKLREVQGMTGATLTSRAVSHSIHKTLVVFQHTLGKN